MQKILNHLLFAGAVDALAKKENIYEKSWTFTLPYSHINPVGSVYFQSAGDNGIKSATGKTTVEVRNCEYFEVWARNPDTFEQRKMLMATKESVIDGIEVIDGYAENEWKSWVEIRKIHGGDFVYVKDNLKNTPLDNFGGRRVVLRSGMPIHDLTVRDERNDPIYYGQMYLSGQDVFAVSNVLDLGNEIFDVTSDQVLTDYERGAMDPNKSCCGTFPNTSCCHKYGLNNAIFYLTEPPVESFFLPQQNYTLPDGVEAGWCGHRKGNIWVDDDDKGYFLKGINNVDDCFEAVKKVGEIFRRVELLKVPRDIAYFIVLFHAVKKFHALNIVY